MKSRERGFPALFEISGLFFVIMFFKPFSPRLVRGDDLPLQGTQIIDVGALSAKNYALRITHYELRITH